METVRTTCAFDCHDACGIDADVEDGRIVRLRGARDHPHTEGFLCLRMNRFLDRLYSPERVTSPLRKTEGGWEKISWDEALDLITGKIRVAVEEYGPLSILYYMSAGSFGLSNWYNIRLFNRLGGPTVSSGTLCHTAGLAGMKRSLGDCVVSEPADMLNSQMVVLWGRNPAAYSVHMVPIIKKARERGAKVLLIDPVRNDSAKFCDRHYAVKPGGDGHLALAICKHLLETGRADRNFMESRSANPEAVEQLAGRFSWETLSEGSGLSVEVLLEIADLFVHHRPAKVCMGRGPQHYRQGSEFTRLILAVCAVSGNLGVKGGGFDYDASAFLSFDRSLDGREFATCHRTMPKALLGEAILSMEDPPLRVAYIHGGNPVTQHPNSTKTAKALRSINFVTVVDAFMTDTAECADLFLPCALFLEEKDVRAASWNPYVGPVVPVVRPPEGVKTDWEILSLLAKRLGIEDRYLGHPIEKLLGAVLRPIAKHGLDPDSAVGEVFRQPDWPKVAFADGAFATPSGQFEFLEEWDPDGPSVGDARYPLNLLSLKDSNFQASQMLESQQEESAPTAWLHPETAARFGIQESAEGQLVSPHGEYGVRFALDDGLRTDVCLARVGGWLKKNRGINVLTEDVLSTAGECPAYYETKVRVIAGG